MPKTLSIKNVPNDLVDRLRRRARHNHRSLQGELLALLEESLGANEILTPGEVLARVRDMGLRTPAESAGMIRVDRDAG